VYITFVYKNLISDLHYYKILFLFEGDIFCDTAAFWDLSTCAYREGSSGSLISVCGTLLEGGRT